MSLLDRTTLLPAIVAGLLTLAPTAVAEAAQPEDEAAGGEEGEGEGEGEGVDLGGGDDDDDDDNDDKGASKPPDPPPDTGGWGVGGKEPDGKYRPAGKTGKLKELEEEEEAARASGEGPPDLPPPGFANLDFAIGFGDITVAEYTEGAADVTPTASFVIGLGYRIGDVWQVFARFPISSAASDGPIDPVIEGARNPDTFKQIAVGSFEVGVRPHFILGRDVRLPVGLALAFPTGQGDMFPNADNQADLGKRIVNVAAASSRGYEDRALFASKRFGITPMGGIIWTVRDVGPGDIRLVGNTKVEIMIKTGGADPENLELEPDELARGEGQPRKLHGASVNWVLGAEGWYDLFDGLLSPGVKLWLAVGTADESHGSIDPGGTQFVFEPNIATHLPFMDDDAFGLDARIGYMIPMGGELGGGGFASASIGALRLTAGFFF